MPIARTVFVLIAPNLPLRLKSFALSLLMAFLLCSYSLFARADEPTEYRLKTAFLYNFATYTQWPSDNRSTFNLCIYGDDPFGNHLDHLLEKKVDTRAISIHQKARLEELDECHLVFISQSAIVTLDSILQALQGKPILTVTDQPGMGKRGVMLNMEIRDGKIAFDANLGIARNAGLNLSSQLLRFAHEVYQE